jgi:uncharacterized membrane protein
VSRSPLLSSVDAGVWRIIIILGATLAVVGGIDLAVLWFPASLETPEWGFGTASTFFDTFPQFGLGVVLLLAASIALNWRWTTRGLATICLLISVLMWLAAFLYLTALPFVTQVAAEPLVRAHVQKATVKTGLQALVYPLLLLLLAVRGWRSTLRAKGGESG